MTKEQLRNNINKDIEKFLKSGGKISVIPSGVCTLKDNVKSKDVLKLIFNNEE